MSVIASRTIALPEQHTLPSNVDDNMHEFTDLQCAATSFVKVLACRPGCAVRLHCTVPTWSTSSTICTDLHDLHELRSRSLVFIHDLCNKLGSAGIQVSYRLAPSDTSLVLLRALPEERASTKNEPQLWEQAQLCGREKAFITSLDGIPSIIIT